MLVSEAAASVGRVRWIGCCSPVRGTDTGRGGKYADAEGAPAVIGLVIGDIGASEVALGNDTVEDGCSLPVDSRSAEVWWVGPWCPCAYIILGFIGIVLPAVSVVWEAPVYQTKSAFASLVLGVMRSKRKANIKSEVMRRRKKDVEGRSVVKSKEK